MLLDNAGEVLLAGPAVRAVARQSHVTFLTAPGGAEAAALLAGVADVLTWRPPWAAEDPPALDAADIALLVKRMAAGSYDDALILTPRKHSPLPAALVLRLAGIAPIAAATSDCPGTLLDVWHNPDPEIGEPDRSLSLARAAGYDLAPGDDGRLAVRRPLPATGAAAALVRHGHRVVLTGRPTGRVRGWVAAASHAQGSVIDLAGRTDLLQLAAVVDRAQAVLAGTPAMAHLAVAVHTPAARPPWGLPPGREPAASRLG